MKNHFLKVVPAKSHERNPFTKKLATILLKESAVAFLFPETDDTNDDTFLSNYTKTLRYD